MKQKLLCILFMSLSCFASADHCPDGLDHDLTPNNKAFEGINLESKVQEDPVGGWNVRLVVTINVGSGKGIDLNHDEFFSPQTINCYTTVKEARTDGMFTGHAHLYIDDKKITRIYAPWFYIPTKWLKKGTNQVRVTLNTNDHGQYHEKLSNTTSRKIETVFYVTYDGTDGEHPHHH